MQERMEPVGILEGRFYLFGKGRLKLGERSEGSEPADSKKLDVKEGYRTTTRWTSAQRCK